MFYAIYIGETDQTFGKIMDDYFSDVQCILKNRQISDSFAAHYEQHFKYTISYTDICKCIAFKVVK